jgi:pimeloyl-ACP methyl ester carboxylesterase
MKLIFINLTCLLTIFNPFKGQSQTIDTLIDVGGYMLHFNIIKGTGIPILFEAGGGEDATTWKNIIKPIADITKTTLITYDRAGFGKSTFDTTKHGILNGIIGLETGLRKLGYNGNIILVAHSQGGLYATLYASRHPDKVKAAVLIDATTSCFYEENRLAATQRSIDEQSNKFKKSNPGSYYQGADFSNNINFVRNVAFPKSIPVTDFVSDFPPFSDKKDTGDWKNCHHLFVSMSPNRTSITAYGCGHFIFEDNPPLVINSIVKAYSGTVDKTKSSEVLKRGIDYAVNTANETKKVETAYRHSEDDLNSWGYKLLQQGEMQKALEVFKLNVLLNPLSWNVYDSYGETLLKNGQKEEAIKAHQKSVELNPKNDNGKKVLEKISKE